MRPERQRERRARLGNCTSGSRTGGDLLRWRSLIAGSLTFYDFQRRRLRTRGSGNGLTSGGDMRASRAERQEVPKEAARGNQKANETPIIQMPDCATNVIKLVNSSFWHLSAPNIPSYMFIYKDLYLSCTYIFPELTLTPLTATNCRRLRYNVQQRKLLYERGSHVPLWLGTRGT